MIQLTTGTADIPAGGPFDPLSYVQGVVDDVDTADVLSASIAVEGAYDISKPGSYQLTYFVTDGAGNQSDPQVFDFDSLTRRSVTGWKTNEQKQKVVTM